MINSILKSLFIAIACLLFTHVKSQSTTFNYLASNLSTTACNVFSTPVPISGYTHNSWAGGVLFNTSNGLLLTTTSSPGATAFYISYPFLSGNSYSFSITAKGDNNTFLKTAIVPNLNQYPTNNPNSCTADPNAYAYSSFGSGQSSNQVPNASTTYNIPQFTIGSTTCQYMLIWVSGGNSNLNAVSISSITINNATPKFSLSPSTLTKACGTAISQTFTVANVNNSSGVTGYTWNVGATNSGWYDVNNNPVSGTITTTTPTLTLTSPANGVTSLSNVTASAQIGSTSYGTNACVVTNTIPSFSITGPGINTICNGNSAAFSTTSGGPVNWSLPPSSYGVLSCTSCANTIFTNNSLYASTTTLTAANSCSSASTVIKLGVPSFPNLPTTGLTVKRYPTYGVIGIKVTNPEATTTNTTYTWKVNGSVVQTSTSPNYSLTIQNCPVNAIYIDYTISVKATNQCGSSEENCRVYRYNCTSLTLASQSYCGPISISRTVNELDVNENQVAIDKSVIYPNPTNGAFKVKLPYNINGSSMINVYDIVGNIVLRQFAKQGTTSVSFTQPLAKGVYTVKIINSSQKKIDVQKLVVD